MVIVAFGTFKFVCCMCFVNGVDWIFDFGKIFVEGEEACLQIWEGGFVKES